MLPRPLSLKRIGHGDVLLAPASGAELATGGASTLALGTTLVLATTEADGRADGAGEGLRGVDRQPTSATNRAPQVTHPTQFLRFKPNPFTSRH
ncbi:MAG: hypothetical protein QM756_03150 [Polyangiaceae bacterium]